MTIDRDRWTDEELIVLDQYQFKCVLCVFQYAVTLHHEPPRSLNPNWKNEPWTMFPLCNAHHETVTGMSRDDAEFMLRHHQEIYFPKSIERIKENVRATTSH